MNCPLSIHLPFDLIVFMLSLDFLRYSTQCPETATTMFSMKMTYGLDWIRTGKKQKKNK